LEAALTSSLSSAVLGSFSITESVVFDMVESCGGGRVRRSGGQDEAIVRAQNLVQL
jgi:hypothetical protein